MKTARISAPFPQVLHYLHPIGPPFLHLVTDGKARALVTGYGELSADAKTFERAGACPILSLDAFSLIHSLELSR
jgi:hypothetical protein